MNKSPVIGGLPRKYYAKLVNYIYRRRRMPYAPAANAYKNHKLIGDIDQKLRGRMKYYEISEEEDKFLESIRDLIHSQWCDE